MRDLGVDAQGAAIARAMIQLAHSLDMTVVAEGVEEEAQADCLRTWGCDLMQGYLYARPLPEGEATALLDAKLGAALHDS